MSGFAAVIAAFALGLSLALTIHLWKHDQPISSVAPEVCEHNGQVKHVVKQDGHLYVTCASGIIVLVQP